MLQEDFCKVLNTPKLQIWIIKSLSIQIRNWIAAYFNQLFVPRRRKRLGFFCSAKPVSSLILEVAGARREATNEPATAAHGWYHHHFSVLLAEKIHIAWPISSQNEIPPRRFFAGQYKHAHIGGQRNVEKLQRFHVHFNYCHWDLSSRNTRNKTQRRGESLSSGSYSTSSTSSALHPFLKRPTTQRMSRRCKYCPRRKRGCSG